MMFQLSDEEVEYLRSQFVTANISSKSCSNPYVFTEQGVYMLMTVLKGELAVRQSIALVRTFKKMKDYILENRDLIGQRELLQLEYEGKTLNLILRIWMYLKKTKCVQLLIILKSISSIVRQKKPLRYRKE